MHSGALTLTLLSNLVHQLHMTWAIFKSILYFLHFRFRVSGVRGAMDIQTAGEKAQSNNVASQMEGPTVQKTECLIINREDYKE